MIIHVKITNGQGKRLLEIIVPHDKKHDDVIVFLDKVERDIERFCKGKL